MLIIRNMPTQMRLFVYATFPIVALVLAGALMGGVFILLALIYMTGFVALMDRIGPPSASDNGLTSIDMRMLRASVELTSISK